MSHHKASFSFFKQTYGFRALYLLILGSWIWQVQAQPSFPPTENTVFDDRSLPSIYIQLPADSLRALLANPYQDREYVAHFVFEQNGLRETVEKVGFRVRGNTSRGAQKKSFKVSFNTYEKGRVWKGLEKLNLNGEHNDPSLLRAKLAWDLQRQMGVPSSRANHVKLYINGDYFGLYLNVENIDEVFIKSRFGNNRGNLYKCLWPADLAWKGEDPNAYKAASGSRRTYELETNTEADDYTSLRNFIKVLNQTPEASFAAEIQKVFNVDGFLRALAVDVLTGSWDNYWYLKNNYYLYHNPATGLFEWLPYDLDNSFGVDFVGRDWGTRNVYTWGSSSEPRPLATRILGVEAFKRRYSFYLKQLLDQYFNGNVLYPKLDRFRDLLKPAALDDTYRLLDYKWEPASFEKSFDEAVGGHVKYGLKGYISLRHLTASSQIQVQNIAPILLYPHVSPLSPALNQPIKISISVLDEQASPTLTLLYKMGTASETSISMRDDGTNGDEIAQDRRFTAQVPPFSQTGTLQWRIEADDRQGGVSFYPFNAVAELAIQNPRLLLNEFMAENTRTIRDEQGEYEDWIELYYAGDASLSLTGYYLTDDPYYPNKFALPPIQLTPQHRFALIWADEDGKDGPHHANFKLSKGGEFLGLATQKPDGSFTFLDSIFFGAQTADISFGRIPDGAATWQFIPKPSPNQGGLPTHLDRETPKTYTLSTAFPNPFTRLVRRSLQLDQAAQVSWRIYDVLGREIEVQTIQRLDPGLHILSWQAPSLPRGWYAWQLEIQMGNAPKKQETTWVLRQ